MNYNCRATVSPTLSTVGHPGGMNLIDMTPEQEALVKVWQKIGHKTNLPYMLLNHMTETEQHNMARVYQTLGLIEVTDAPSST